MGVGYQLELFPDFHDSNLEEVTLKVIEELRNISEDVYYDDNRLDAKKTAFLNRLNDKASVVDTLAIELALIKRGCLDSEELTDYYRNSPVVTLKKSLLLLEGIKELDEISEEDFTVTYIASEVVAKELLHQNQKNFVIRHYTGDEL